MDTAQTQTRAPQERVLPHSIESEQSVLGALLFDNNVVGDVVQVLREEDFYRDSHGRIFRAIVSLFDKNEPIDQVTLQNELKKQGDLDRVGGIVYLSDLLDAVPTASNVVHYARVVREKSILRTLVASCTDLISAAYDPTNDVDQLLDMAEARIFEIAENKQTQAYMSIRELVMDALDVINDRRGSKGDLLGIQSGFGNLDAKLGGLQPSDLVIIAARPSMGKTSFALNIMQKIALRKENPKGVAMFSLEMSKEQLVERLLCSEARVDSHKVRKGEYVDADFADLAEAAGKFYESKIYIDDTPSITVLDLRAKARRLKALEGIDMIIIDYLQLMRASAKSLENRQQEISEISRSLKALARELKVPVVALSQLNRAVDSRTPPRPMLSDLRESGAIEQDADVVVMLLREAQYAPEEHPDDDIAEVIIAKHRNGPTGVTRLAFLKQYTRFEDAELFLE
ncbi:replicative DNA helicase [Candidatus Hydrogenedentota bacterium]